MTLYGFLRTDDMRLDSAHREEYRAWYCGLCRTIGIRYGLPVRLTLSYDMATAAYLMGELSGISSPNADGRCILHPLGKRTEFTAQEDSHPLVRCADFSVIFACLKCEDDIADEGSHKASLGKRLLSPYYETAVARLPREASELGALMEQLRRVEHRDELNPDIPADLFGCMTELLFREVCSPEVAPFAHALGRCVYLMDAATDLYDDRLHMRYNPFVMTPYRDVETILSMELSHAWELYSAQVSGDTAIFENILFSGIWIPYRLEQSRHKIGRERSDQP